MAYYIEEEVWKCPKHPSKKRRTTTGVCSICLRDRLTQLCPHCANVRPCSSNCAAAATTTSLSSSSSGKIDGGEPAFCRSKSVGIPFLKSRNVISSSRSNQPESEKSNKISETAALCRSKSVGIPFLKSRNVNSSSRKNQPENENNNKIGNGGETEISKSKSVGIPFLKSLNVNSSSQKNQPESEKSNEIGDGSETEELCRSKSVGIPLLKSGNVNSVDRRKTPESEKSDKTASFWRNFKLSKRGKAYYCNDTRIKEFAMTTVMRSRSVNVTMTSVSGGDDVNYSPGKLKGWYLASPMKVFRQSGRAPKLVN